MMQGALSSLTVSLPHRHYSVDGIVDYLWIRGFVVRILVCDHPRGDHGVIRIWPAGSFSGSGAWDWCNVSIFSRQADNSPCLKLLKVSLGASSWPLGIGTLGVGGQLPISFPKYSNGPGSEFPSSSVHS